MLNRICLWLTIVGSLSASLQAADRLEWKLSTGDSLQYAVQNEMITTSTVGGFDNRTRLTQSMHMAWDVQTVTAGGSYVLSQVIQRIRVEMAPDGKESIVFDSAAQDVPDDPIARSLGNVFRRLVNRKFMITMSPRGTIEDVAIPNDLLETLKTAAAGTPNGLDENALKQMLSQTSVILPANPVNVDDQWASEQTVELPFAKLRMDAQMTYRGVNDQQLALIGYVPKVTLVPVKDSPVQLTLNSSRGTGEILFDQEQGRVARMQLNLHMDMQTAIRGQQVLQKIDQQTIMILKD